MNKTSIIEALQLQPHREGGYFRRTYRSELTTTLSDTGKRQHHRQLLDY